MAESRTIIRVFVASPDDCVSQRAVVRSVVEQLNHDWVDFTGLELQFVDWTTASVPGIADYPQLVIERSILSYDIFIGVLGTRFGSPTPRSGSGTEEEFDGAYDRYARDPDSVRIMVYFNEAAVKPSRIDPDQWKSVRGFKLKVANRGGLYQEFDSDEHLRDLVRYHLSADPGVWDRLAHGPCRVGISAAGD